ncbi:MAG: phasin family protein [Egibacteraceae bacterium]
MEKDWQKKYWGMASGLVEATQKRAEPVVRAMVKQGEIAAEKAEKAVDELLKASQSNRKALSALVRSETERAVERLGLVRRSDLRHLERKIEKLERQVASSPGGAKKSTPKKAAKRSSAAKRSAGKKTAKKSAGKKSAASTGSAKKSTPPSDAGER